MTSRDRAARKKKRRGAVSYNTSLLSPLDEALKEDCGSGTNTRSFLGVF